VKTGDEIGYLVVGEPNYYPHVHYALMYKDSEEYNSYFEVMSDIDSVPNFHPDDIPGGVPRKGPGSHGIQ
jgi:hypothetical protein